MRNLLACALTAVALLVASSTVYGQGVITNVKTPPLQASDVITLPIAIHNTAGNPPWAGWAGARMKVHILDAGEVDIDSLTPVAGLPTGGTGPVGPTIDNPFGPRSQNEQSVPQFFTMWHPEGPQSGINITPSINQPIFDMQVHVKNSDPSGNSDVDVTFQFWNIWHVRDNPTIGSTFFPLEASDYVWVPASIQDIQQLHIPPGQQFASFYHLPRVEPGTPGKWLHLPTRPDGNNIWEFHLDGGPGSQYYATFLNTAYLGIEHVPEPTGIILLGTGLACSVFGTWCRARRRKQAA